jgi:hypothetical protein
MPLRLRAPQARHSERGPPAQLKDHFCKPGERSGEGRLQGHWDAGAIIPPILAPARPKLSHDG